MRRVELKLFLKVSYNDIIITLKNASKEFLYKSLVKKNDKKLIQKEIDVIIQNIEEKYGLDKVAVVCRVTNLTYAANIMNILKQKGIYIKAIYNDAVLNSKICRRPKRRR